MSTVVSVRNGDTTRCFARPQTAREAGLSVTQPRRFAALIDVDPEGRRRRVLRCSTTRD
jgi:hypothetical protein